MQKNANMLVISVKFIIITTTTITAMFFHCFHINDVGASGDLTHRGTAWAPQKVHEMSMGKLRRARSITRSIFTSESVSRP